MTARSLCALLSIVAFGACARPDTHTSTTPPAATETETETEAVTTPEEASTRSDTFCAGREGCAVVARRAAGTSGDGVALEVVSISLGPEIEDDVSRCERFEHWLVAGDVRTLLVAACNDGYGAAGVGEDTLDVDPGSVTHTRSGGSNWRWSTRTRIALDPVHVAYEVSFGSFTLGPNAEETTFRFDAFTGAVRWGAPACEATEGADTIEPALDFAYRPIPIVDLPSAYADGGWRETPIGGCAVRVTSGQDGAIRGPASDPATAETNAAFAVVMADEQTLFVEITDDTQTAPGARVADAVELYVSDALVGYMSHCLGTDLAPVPPIRVPLAGRAPRLPQGITVETARAGATTRLRVRFVTAPRLLSIVYVDSDDGRTEARAIATSHVEGGRPESLGRPLRVPPERATCGVREGRLEPSVTLHTGSGQAVVP